MFKWILSKIDGPLVAKGAGVIVGFLATWFASVHYPLDDKTQAALIVGITGLIEKGIQIGSAYSGNSVTSTVAANAHPPIR